MDKKEAYQILTDDNQPILDSMYPFMVNKKWKEAYDLAIRNLRNSIGDVYKEDIYSENLYSQEYNRITRVGGTFKSINEEISNEDDENNYLDKEEIRKVIKDIEENGYWDFLEERDSALTIKILKELLDK